MSLTLAVLAPAVPPVVGGVESYVEMYLLALLDAGTTMHLLTGNRPRSVVEDRLTANGGSVTVTGAGSLDGQVEWERATFERAQALFSLLQWTHVDIVHAWSHDTVLAATIARAAPPYDSIPLVITPGEMSTEDTDFGRARSAFVYRLPIDGLLHTSNYYVEVARSYGCRPRMTKVSAAVAYDTFAAGDRRIGRRLLAIDEDDILVCCPSRFTPRKRQLDLLAAVEFLPAHLGASLVVVLTGSTHSGSSDYLRLVQEAAATASVPVRIHMGVAQEDMPHVLAAADVVVQPSMREGLGLAALEAMAAGTPVVLTDVSGFDEIATHDETAVFVPPADPPALADGIARVLTDQRFAARLAEQARVHVRQMFHPAALARDALAMFRRLASTESKGVACH